MLTHPPARQPDSPPPRPTWRWDLFCRVVDNYGDLGVCHRAALHLAANGQCVRLWVDDAALMARMAPDIPVADEPFWRAGAPGVAWVHWTPGAGGGHTPGHVVVEAFGCDPPPAFVQRMAQQTPPPVWINLEYLSAEDYVERSHGLPSPQWSGPGKGLTKWFFYPGFQEGTGGLLRERNLLERRQRFDRLSWLQGLGLGPLQVDELVMPVFAYESAPLESLLHTLSQAGPPVRLLLAYGPLQDRAQDWLSSNGQAGRRLQVERLPWLSAEDFDHLLWSGDLNWVRGEDSLVRALWAGAPFVWQLYPQADGAHAHKLQAFWDWLQASDDIRGPGTQQAAAAPAPGMGLAADPVAGTSPSPDDTARRAWPWWAAWNGLQAWPEDATWPWEIMSPWGASMARVRDRLLRRPPLADALLEFVAARRPPG